MKKIKKIGVFLTVFLASITNFVNADILDAQFEGDVEQTNFTSNLIIAIVLIVVAVLLGIYLIHLVKNNNKKLKEEKAEKEEKNSK